MRTPCLVYTALFDLSRESVDGRSIQQYLDWLRETALIFPGLIVFHDGSCDKLEVPGIECIKIEKSELLTFTYLNPLKELLRDFKPIATRDITFSLPEYALVQFAKFELANKLLEERSFDSILWVDAGISRFIDKTKPYSSLMDSMFLKQLLNFEYQFAFEIDLRRNITIPRLKVPVAEFGSCRRIISGTSFWIRRDGIDLIWKNVQQHLSSMISRSVWDNEQVYLREFLGNSNHETAFVLQSKSSTGTLARVLLGEQARLPIRFSKFLCKMLRYKE